LFLTGKNEKESVAKSFRSTGGTPCRKRILCATSKVFYLYDYDFFLILA